MAHSARKRRPVLKRDRRGWLLTEVVVTIVIASMVLLGFGAMLYNVNEQMHISWELRLAEQFGYYYVNMFADKVRNGTGIKITRVTAPSSAELDYIDPFDPTQVPHRYEFQYDRRTQTPIVRIDDQKHYYPAFPPVDAGPNDEFTVDPSSFIIKDYDKIDESVDPEFRKSLYTVEFTIIYRHRWSLPGQGVFEKELHFTSTAYTLNDKWPNPSDPFTPSEGDG